MAGIEDSYLIDLKHDADFSAAPNGDLNLIKGIDNLKQALYHRLTTVPGALVHRPNYGVGVQRWQNDISSFDRQKALALRIKEQFEQDERLESVDSVRVLNIKDNGSFEVTYFATASGGEKIGDTINVSGGVN